MKMKLLLLLALAIGAWAAPSSFGQATQPLVSVAVTEVKVSGGQVYGSDPDAGSGLPVNAGYGSYTSKVTISAQATGVATSFTYTFYVNGQYLGVGTSNSDGSASITWTPSQPGVYYFSASASGGSASATSLAVEYFATGIEIVSPISNQLLPVGSSIVIEAAAAVNAGAISRVDFYADEGSGPELIGSSDNYPYSVIYTPSGPATSVRYIYAKSYLADGVTQAGITPLQGIVMAAAVLPLPTCSITYPAQSTPPATIPIPDYTVSGSAYIPVQVSAGAGNGGTITQVQLYINGVLFGTVSALPYTFKWQPQVAGVYSMTALAFDAKNNIIASTTSKTATITPAPTTVLVGTLPSVAITSPEGQSTLTAGTPTGMTAIASDSNTDVNGNPVSIQSVQFFQDGVSVGTSTAPDSLGNYTISWKPTQNVNPQTGLPQPSLLTALATDTLGFQNTSPSVTVTVATGTGGGGGVSTGTPPTVSLTAPANNATLTVNQPVTFQATASAPNGYVQSVSFLVDGAVVGTASAYPYATSWTPKNLGFYKVTANVIDNFGDSVNSSPITVTVVAPAAPTVSISSPSSGGILTVNSAVTISASAASSTGTITSVQFYENGQLIGTSTTPPYSISFTPNSTGIYTLTAIATDYAGQTTTSGTVTIEVAPANNSANTLVYFGNYQGLSDSGIFGLAVVDGTTATFIGQQTSGKSSSPGYLPDIAVSSQGALSTAAGLTGTAATTGVNGTLSGGETYIGSPSASGSAPSGYFVGSINGVASSQFTAIVGTDGQIMVYVSNGSYTDSGYGPAGTFDTSGNFSVTLKSGATLAGAIDTTTNLVNATLSGSSGGTVLGAKASGGLFSDGTLRNLSTRGMVGSGANAMVAGFVVNGSASKNLLIRAVGPTLTSLGVTGAVSATQLTVYNASGSVVASNTGWNSTTTNASSVSAAETQVGAFALQSNLDSALVSSFAPGAYTANVAGVSGATGTGLVEVWDLDTFTPFTSNKLINVSTRANVGTGQNVLIAGFVINGSAPKKVLIRGPGPSLGNLGVSGALATPHLQLYNSSQQVIRENYSWGVGNDAGMVTAAAKVSGAFAYTSGSADSAILAVLAPGTYTVELSSSGSTTGVALIEVYEVP